jgi:hypothetical protein
MKKKTVITLIACVVFVLATAGGLWWYDIILKADAGAEPDGSTSGQGSSTGTPASVFPLIFGSRGTDVRALQKKMNEWMSYYYMTLETKPSKSQLTVDGVWGSKTAEFVNIIFKTATVTQTQYTNFINLQIVPSDATQTWNHWGLF